MDSPAVTVMGPVLVRSRSTRPTTDVSASSELLEALLSDVSEPTVAVFSRLVPGSTSLATVTTMV